MIAVPLTRGFVALLDDNDLPLVDQYKWFVHIHPNKHGIRYYAATRERRTQIIKYMHRLLMGAQKGHDIDHINHNGLDNRRCNLRACTRSENMANVRKYRGMSCYKGVSWSNKNSKWQATVCANGKQHFLGTFINEADAAVAYDNAAQKLFGEFAFTNFH
jgi:hypothetical protein